MNLRLEIDLGLDSSSLSSIGFLILGSTADFLRISGTQDSVNDKFTILIMVWRIQTFMILAGIGSNMHDLAQVLPRRVDSSITDVGVKECSSFVAGQTIFSSLGFKRGKLSLFLVVSTLCTKTSVNLFARSTALSFWGNFFRCQAV